MKKFLLATALIVVALLPDKATCGSRANSTCAEPPLPGQDSPVYDYQVQPLLISVLEVATQSDINLYYYSGSTSNTGSETGTITSPQPADTETHKIIFGANFDTNSDCADRNEQNQCDLYTADLDLDDGTVSTVTRATETPVSESYPAWNPNGTVAYFSIFKNVHSKDLGVVDLTTGETNTLTSNASWPEVSPDGKTLLYEDTNTSQLMQASLSADGLSISNASPVPSITDGEDSQYSGDGRYIVFHQTRNGSGAVAQVYDTQTQTSTSWGEKSGHCAFGLESLTTLCDNSTGGGLLKKIFDGNKFGSTSLFLPDPSAELLSAYDPDFASCQGISFNYPNFCGDDEHLLVSTSCNSGGTVTFSRLFLIDFTNDSPVYRPIGKELKDAYGGTGMSSWTVSCLE